jgi:adenosylcobyric acid synthase
MFEGEEDGYPLGITNKDGTIIGTYLHGFLDNDIFRNHLLNHVRQKRNLPHPEKLFDYTFFRKQQLDQLEQQICSALDMNQIETFFNN